MRNCYLLLLWVFGVLLLAAFAQESCLPYDCPIVGSVHERPYWPLR